MDGSYAWAFSMKALQDIDDGRYRSILTREAVF
jgi:hypothetical protein